LSRPHSAKGLTSVPDAAWETARRRERIVRPLLQNPVAYGARSEAVAAAAAELDVTIQYLYRLIKVYEADPRTRSLLPRSPGGVADEPPCTEYQSVLSTRMNLDAGSGTENRCPRRLGPRRDAGARGSPEMPGAGDNGPRDGDGTRMIPPKAAGALASTLASTLTSKPIRSLLNGSTRQNGGGPGAGSAPTRLLN